MVSMVGAPCGRPEMGERSSPPQARRANPMVGATRRVARSWAARRAAPTFRNDEVAAQRSRWTFYETIILYFLNVLASSPNSRRAASVDIANPRPSNL
jgi:hypothetical protein